MKSPVNKEEFVTVLKVDSVLDSQEIDSSSFVTVVELEGCKGGSKEVTKRTVCQEEVIMYRLPGERLGMGLKFEGGMQATECVSHVYIQSIAPDSPASRTETSWNGLAEGDEILEIDGRSVNHMTRVDCVTTLKKAPVAIRLLILHGIPNTKPSSKSDLASSPNGFQMNHVSSRHLGPPPPVPALSLNGTQMSNAYVQNSRPHCYTDIMPSKSHCHLPEVPLSPPPVPPRKLKARKGSTSSSESSPPSVYVPKKPKKAETGVQRDNNNSKVLNDSDLDGCNQKSNTFLGTKLPGWEELMLRRFSASSLSEDIVLPVPSECHVDLVAEEDRRSMMNEYESDDTGSSASTVIERFSSAVGSVHSLVAKSNEKHSIDISQVLGPFEQLEKEIEADFSLTSRPSNNCSSKHSQENRVADDKPLTIVPVPELLTPPTNKTIEPPDIFKDSGPDLSESQNVSCPVVGQISEHPLDIDLSKKNLPINDPCEKRRIDGVDISAAESGYDCQHIYSEPILLETESEIQPPPKRKLTPPPVPPRKLKNGRRNSEEQLQNSKSDRYQDGLVDDDFESPPASMSFPIIGNLLQELEQLPEFHRSSRM